MTMRVRSLHIVSIFNRPDPHTNGGTLVIAQVNPVRVDKSIVVVQGSAGKCAELCGR